VVVVVGISIFKFFPISGWITQKNSAVLRAVLCEENKFLKTNLVNVKTNVKET
jgi:hypothetical protein